jgi:hypothetical protein
MLACGTAVRLKARGRTASEGRAPDLSHFLIKQATDLPFRARCIPGKESPNCCKRRTGLTNAIGLLHMEYPLLFVNILTRLILIFIVCGSEGNSDVWHPVVLDGVRLLGVSIRRS